MNANKIPDKNYPSGMIKKLKSFLSKYKIGHSLSKYKNSELVGLFIYRAKLIVPDGYDRNLFVLNLYKRKAHEAFKVKTVTKPIKKSLNDKIFDAEIKTLRKKDYNTFLKSNYWQKVKKIVLNRDKNKYTRCGDTKNLHVHHTTYKNHFKEHKHTEDLLTLCGKCHEEYHIHIGLKPIWE